MKGNLDTTMDQSRRNPFGRNPLPNPRNGPLIDRALEDGEVLNLLEEPEALEELYPFQKHRDPLADTDAHAAKCKFLLALMEFLHGG